MQQCTGELASIKYLHDEKTFSLMTFLIFLILYKFWCFKKASKQNPDVNLQRNRELKRSFTLKGQWERVNNDRIFIFWVHYLFKNDFQIEMFGLIISLSFALLREVKSSDHVWEFVFEHVSDSCSRVQSVIPDGGADVLWIRADFWYAAVWDALIRPAVSRVRVTWLALTVQIGCMEQSWCSCKETNRDKIRSGVSKDCLN